MPLAHKPNSQRIVAAVRDALGSPTEPLLLHGPVFAGNEWRYLKDCIDTSNVSSSGSYVTEFENRLAQYTGAAHVIATVNGTTALHLALMLAGTDRDTEVLLPSLTFVATANAVAHCGAIPHFCDVENRTMGMDAGKLADHLQSMAERRKDGCYNRRTGRRIAAIVPMHTFGHPVDLDPLLELSRRWNVPVVEDAAESLGSSYHGRHTGTFGKIGILSFNGNKVVTTGGGGAILTNDDELGQHAKHLATTAKVPHPWEFVHDETGYNYTMPSLNAALGCAQMEQLPGFLDHKRKLAQLYIKALSGLEAEGVTVFAEPPGCVSNYWLNALVLDSADEKVRDELLGALNDAHLQCRPIWRPMHMLSMYADCPRMDMAVTESLAARVINLPSSANLLDPARNGGRTAPGKAL
ncbi:MAG: LegC family aminotransferase [Planctomycetia bacterium]|nr:LegC family aminotransferase [Planctomycetia bacterium]